MSKTTTNSNRKNLENYTKEELTIHAGKAQLAAFLYFLPFLVIFVIPFFLLWGNTTKESFTQFREIWGDASFLILMGLVLIGIVVHELIHGFTWAIFSKEGIRSIRYGVIWKYMIVDLLRKQSLDNWAQDHPSKIGCYIYKPNE